MLLSNKVIARPVTRGSAGDYSHPWKNVLRLKVNPNMPNFKQLYLAKVMVKA